MNRDTVVQNPFVGLRPFESRDSLYYFGRKEQTHALLKQLYANRFVAVVGSSGCGKSSLVRAGLIPNLEAGFLVQDRDLWEIATFKPGDAPLYHLAASLASLTGIPETPEIVENLLETLQRRGAQALVELAQTTLNGEDSNLLIVVDQFEELFRFQQTRTTRVREEAADFVSILLSLAEQTTVPIYIILTMRSDFLGECDAYQGLPEAMNNSQYLVPRLTRQQRREAFLGPIRLAGADMTPRLLDRLLNESLDTRDDLPVLQHVLMRTWNVWAEDNGRGMIDLEHYERAGTLKNALRLHADEALKDLDEGNRLIARHMFQALTETDASNRRIRRPARLSQIAAICCQEVVPETLMSLIKRFNGDNRNFLVLSSQTSADDPMVDISHESLIRQWKTLGDWVDQEAESARIYQRLAQSAELHADGKAGLYKETDLQVALDWQRKQQPNAEWAVRHNPNFNLAMDFLERSVNQPKAIKMFIISLLVCVYACIYSWLLIATTDDVSLATNSTFIPIIGAKMPANLVYTISPLMTICIYAWFLFHLQRLGLRLSLNLKETTGGKSLMAWLNEAGLHALAWITVPMTFIGLWVHYLLRRDWTVTGFHIFFLTLSIIMAVFFHQSSSPRGEKWSASLKPRHKLRVSRIVCVVMVALVVWILSLGVFKGIPEHHLNKYSDVHAIVPWLFNKIGYDVFFNFREQNVSKLPDNYWRIKSESDRMNVIIGAPLKKADLRYANMVKAFIASADLQDANLRGSDLRKANLRYADLRSADLQKADLKKSELQNARLKKANLQGANLLGAYLEEVDFQEANLIGVTNLSIEQISKVKTLYKARLDPKLLEQIQKEYPDLLDEPKDLPNKPKSKDLLDKRK